MGEETNPEQDKKLQKFMEKQKQMELQMQAMIEQQQQAENAIAMEQQQKEQQWVDEHKMLVPKELLEDCYLFNITGDFNSLFKTIETLCKVVQQSQTNDETRMLIDKSLMIQLINSNEARNKDGEYAIINEIFRSMSPNQRETLVKPLIQEIQEKGEMEHWGLIQTLKDSIWMATMFTLP